MDFKSGKVKIKLRGEKISKLLTLFFNKGIVVENLKKIDIVTYECIIYYKNFEYIKQIANENDVYVYLLRGFGISRILIGFEKKIVTIFCVALFAFLLKYYSSFVWDIKVDTKFYLSKREVIERIKKEGITYGTNEKDIQYKKVEENLCKKYSDIVWIRIRKNGGILNVSVIEREGNVDKEYEEVVTNKSEDVLASKDGEVQTIYSIRGTAIAKSGDNVKKGDVLIKGSEGKEGLEYEVEAEGIVMAKTKYIYSRDIVYRGEKYVHTGEEKKDYSLNILNKDISLKKTYVKFKKYDKMKYRILFFNIMKYRELTLEKFSENPVEVKKEAAEEMLREITLNIGKDGNILEKNVSEEINGDILTVTLEVTILENIAN